MYTISLSYYDVGEPLSPYLVGAGSLATYSLQNALTIGQYSHGYPFEPSAADLNISARAYQYGISNGWETEDFGASTFAFYGGDTCKTGGGNCTEACSGGFGNMFDFLPTLHNCLILPNISTTADQQISTDDELYGPEGLNPTAILKQQYYRPANKTVGDHVIETINQCLTDYCNTFTGCTRYLEENKYAFHNDTSVLFGQFGYGSSLVTGICDNVPTEVLSDVGGIGVYLSYWIQPGVALIAFLMTLFWMFLGPYIYLGLYAGFRCRAGARARIRKARHKSQRHLARLAVALVDFQKAQCFFMVATNIAALVVMKTAGLQPASLQQAYNTFYVLRLVAVNGYLPVTFTLFNLQILGMVSWYLIILSTVSIFLSIGTLVAAGDFSPAKADVDYLHALAKKGGPQSCDYRQPGVYCFQSFTDDFSALSGVITIKPANILAFCLSMFLLLIIVKLKAFWLRFFVKIQPKLRPFYERLRTFYERTEATCIRCGQDPRTIRTATTIQESAITVWQHPVSQRAIAAIIDTSTKTWRSITNFHRSHPLPRFVTNTSHRLATFTRLSLRTLQLSIEHHVTRFRSRDAASKWRAVGCLLLYAIYIILFAIYLQFFIVLYVQLVTIATENVYNTTWNFGQVVALSVWLPPLCEFVYLELRGVREGFRYRLRGNMYKVVRVEEDDEGSDDGTGEDVEKGNASDDDKKTHELEDTPSQHVDDHSDKKDTISVHAGPDEERGLHPDSYIPTRRSLSASRPPSYRPEATQQQQELQQEGSRRPSLAPSATSSSTSPASPDARSVGRDANGGAEQYWLLPEPELPSRSITLSEHDRPREE